jgi:membrane fusion protein (multidrug efflux system)
LAEAKAVSESELDAAVARHDASIASVEAAEANLRASKIQLGYTKIYSPIDGIIGKTQAKVGDFVGKNPNPVILNVVSNIDTVLVEFFITEKQYLQLFRHVGGSDQAAQEQIAADREKADLELMLADGSFYEHKGKFDFIDRQVDPTTGAILIQASFPNPQGMLRPGLFAKIKAEVARVGEGILVPQRCVTELQGLFSVFVVGEGNKIERREIKAGPTIDDTWLILEGLEAGETVVYEGLQAAKDGTVVNPKPRESVKTEKKAKEDK